MNNARQMNESCRVTMSHVSYEWTLPAIWMSHVAYEWVTSHMNESRRIWMSNASYMKESFSSLCYSHECLLLLFDGMSPQFWAHKQPTIRTNMNTKSNVYPKSRFTWYTATHCNTLLHCNTLQRTTVLLHSVIHCPARCCNTQQDCATHYYTVTPCNTLLHCNTLKHTAQCAAETHCNALHLLLGALLLEFARLLDGVDLVVK